MEEIENDTLTESYEYEDAYIAEPSKEIPQNETLDPLASVKLYTVIRGDTAFLTCELETQIAGYDYGISWLKDNGAMGDSGTLLPGNPRFFIFNEFNLQIERVQFEDAGEYSCYPRTAGTIVYNLLVFDSVEASNKANYQSKPSAWVKAIVNETIILPCQQINRRGFYFKWEKDGVYVTERSTDLHSSRKLLLVGTTLEIQELQPGDNFTEFTCSIGRTYYKESGFGRNFTTRLIISEETFNKSNGSNRCLPSPCGLNSECYFKDDLVECACRINFDGYPPNCTSYCADYECSEHVVCISERCKVICSSLCGPNAECVIKNLKYVCTCLNGYYGDPYVKCDRTKKASDSLAFYSIGQTYEVFMNSNVILDCTIYISPGPKFYFSWQKPSADLSYQYKMNLPESKIKEYTQRNLFIERVQKEDAGLYSCICKIEENQSIQKINYILEISDSDTSVTKSYSEPFATIIRAKINDKVILPCEQRIDFVTEISTYLGWYKFADSNVSLQEFLDDSLKITIFDARRKILFGYHLEIQNVQPSDESNYSCVLERVEKDEGLFMISHRLKIKDAPSLDPCLLAPCGENSDCYTANGNPVCSSCRMDFSGRPPNCLTNCDKRQMDKGCFPIACVSDSCKSLCELTCRGNNRECRVRDYKWTCMCGDGQFESPTGQCSNDKIVDILIRDSETCGSECLIFSIGGPILFLVLIIGATIFIRKKMRKSRIRSFLNEDITLHLLPQYVSTHPNFYDEKWEFSRQRLEIKESIGEGHFGKVLRAEASGLPECKGTTVVAVKTLKANATGAHLEDLISEYEFLKELDHPNVIRLLGVCTKNGPLYIILEYAENGSLSSYLRGIKKEIAADKMKKIYAPVFTTLSPKEILSFAWQIAKGMSYLADMKYVHRDLAARNILLTKDLTCKISDFGLTRDVYQDGEYFKTSRAEIPIKWMAIESLFNDSYSTKSDVWSFGVVLWELITFGETPYPEVHVRNIYNYLKQGNRMGKPEGCSDEFYEIMLSCWRENSEDRPDFKDLVEIFDEMLSEGTYYLQCSEKDNNSENDGEENDDYLSPRSDPKLYVNTKSTMETEL